MSGDRVMDDDEGGGDRGGEDNERGGVDGADGGEYDRCAEPDCERTAAVAIHDPRGADRAVCLAHARALATREGVVAQPLPDADVEWPGG